MGWISPTGHETPTQWTNPQNAYDDDEATWALSEFLPNSCLWCTFLVLTIAPAITSDKVRFKAQYSDPGIDQIDLDVYKDGEWVHVYQGSFANLQWVEKTFPQGTVSKMRLRFHTSADFKLANLRETDFWEVEAPPPAVGGHTKPYLVLTL